MKLYSIREEQRKGYALMLVIVFAVTTFLYGISWSDSFGSPRKMMLMLFAGILCGLCLMGWFCR